MAEASAADGYGSRRNSLELPHEMHLEQFYSAFVCPLTSEIMRDPVSIETGHTFEREAIEKHFRKCREKGKRPTCPLTFKELHSVDLSPSIALRNAIEEWTKRNEAVMIDMARRSLSNASPEADVLQSLDNIQLWCQKHQSRKPVILSASLIPLITEMLKSTSSRVRLKSLETLRIVAEGDDENKETIGAGDTIRTIVKFLSQNHSQAKEEAVFLLHELSKSEILSEKIGEVYGAVLILVGMASSKSENVLVVQSAEKTLENLETCEKNVLQMAENGRLQPLLRLLLEGSAETKLAMAAHLGDLALSNDDKLLVAETAGSSLVNFLRSGTKPAREAALKALNQISSYQPSAEILVRHDLLPPLITALFTVGPHQLPARLKELSASILADLVLFGPNLSFIPLNPSHETLVSESVIHNLLHLISNTGPAIECKLLQVLVGLTTSSATAETVVAAVKSSGAAMSLIQFAQAPQRDLRLVAIKLLHNLSYFMMQELGAALESNSGQISGLVRILSEDYGAATEEQAETAGLLSELPNENLSLTRRLLSEGAFNAIIFKLRKIQHGEARSSRFSASYLEGLVRLLARVTFLLPEDPGVLEFCRENNLCIIFTEMLQRSGMDRVQVSSATALEQLSKQTRRLTRVIPHARDSGSCWGFFSCLSSEPAIPGLCQIHRGVCSMKESFCLVQGRAVEKLVSCLDHSNELVVEAAMAALCTLLEDGLEIEAAVQLLWDEDAVKPVFDVLVEGKREELRHRAVWAVERILRNEDIAKEVSGNQSIESAIVEAFRNSDNRTKQLAEKALHHIDRLPKFSGIFPNRI